MRRVFLSAVLMCAGVGLQTLPAQTFPYDHVHVNVPDPAAAANWYEKYFGGKRITEAPDRLMFGSTRFMFLKKADAKPSAGSAIDHVGFSFADVDAKFKEFEAAGAPAATTPAPAPVPDPAPVVAAVAPAPAPATAPAPKQPTLTPAQAALKAIVDAALPPWKDGTYEGWGTCRHGDLSVKVVIEGGKITSAFVAQCLTRYSCDIIDKLPPQVVAKQSPETSYISGATQSTDAYYWAVVVALGKAK